ncbi:15148_t:CDS:2 [Entrophospora sp. SA101]|nr:9537_t:CDS:2 [Entrophospora sp. SA101]CAJ0750247.1 15148_t:CDS:2 [Entrophospora sp. SA101]CAJ0884635.1 13309_t:CDS:2 [Entrophospora sp. SA101]CAJ0915913.1 5156_t:CDS:2 [Entrophospora sp. SA101]
MNNYNETPILKSKIVKDEFYQKNYKEMSAMVDTLNDRLSLAANQGGKKAISQHLKRGQLLVRDRIDLLLDEDSPFLELCPLAGWGQEDMTLGGSVVAGIGLVCGVECLISGNVPTLFGGSSNEISVLKSSRISTISLENGLPYIQLIQTGGAKLDQQFRVFHPGGAQFRYLAERTKIGLPTCSIVFGSSTAGGAYTPSLTDYVIMVKNQAQVFLGGPPLVKMATGEVVDAESLGGADMHSRKSGVSDQLALDEYDAIKKAREFVGKLNWTKRGLIPSRHFSSKIEPPLYDLDELLGIVSSNIKIPFDANEVITRIVDGSRFTSFKSLYGQNLITGWGYIHGFMVGKKFEEEGIIKAGVQFVNAVSNSEVPAITIMMGASYGAGNYAMCGRAFKPSKCSVMGAEQLIGVMDLIMREAASRVGKSINEEEASVRNKLLQNMVEQESDVYYTTSRLLDDGVIDPRMTRVVIGFCLSVIYNVKVQGGHLGGVSRM